MGRIFFVLVALFYISAEVCSYEIPLADREYEKERSMHPSAVPLLAPGKRAQVERTEYWFKSAQDMLASKLKQKNIEREAKNVIFFLGDGMGVSTVTAARILKGQQVDKLSFGEESELHFETFPFTAVSKTFCADAQIADSACSATAFLGGSKANSGTIGVTPDVLRGDCVSQGNKDLHVSSALAWAQAAGKSTGVVTTTRITHATPAGAYAHSANRDWESDADLAKDVANPYICDDIAKQLILSEPGKNINVILGGGRRQFYPTTDKDSEGISGYRLDGRHLINSWIADKNNTRSAYIEGYDELLKVNTAETEFLLGLFASSHIAYLEDQAKDNDPSLEEMTRVAIEILSKNPKGYFLLVEGGRIDHAHHDTRAQRALWETIEFAKAIEKADETTAIEDTLILVTADHTHVMTINGYPTRGHPLMEIAETSGIDGLPYATLSYANGPGYRPTVDNQRVNITSDEFDDLTYKQVAMVPLSSESHGGDDVMIYSRGPFAHLLTGVQQQSYIPHVIGYAACIGPFNHYCKDSKNSNAVITPMSFTLIFIISALLSLRYQ